MPGAVYPGADLQMSKLVVYLEPLAPAERIYR